MYKNVSGSVKKFTAYTLFETLIVIGVVGFLAVLVIGPFMSFPQKYESIVRVKKAYSEVNGVLLKLTADSGCVDDLRCTGIFDFGTTDQSLGDALGKYFKIVKTCGTIPNIGCMSGSVSTHYDGTAARTSFDGDGYRFIANNGAAISISNYSNNCMIDGSVLSNVKVSNSNKGCSNDQNGDANGNNGNDNNSNDKNGSGNGNNGQSGNEAICAADSAVPVVASMTQVCGSIYIDTNGPMHGPNNFGRDIFAFWITNGKGPILYPMGADDDNTLGWWKDPKTEFPRYCYPSHTDGAWCAGRILEEGWQMNY